MTDTTEYKVPFPIYHITYDSIHTWDALRQAVARDSGGGLLGQRFTERLCYNSAVEGLSPVLEHEYRYDGTVSAYACHVTGETFQQGYTQMYDGLNRLTAAHLTGTGNLIHEYDENGNMTKDLNFSIKREQSMLECSAE